MERFVFGGKLAAKLSKGNGWLTLGFTVPAA